MHINRKEAGQAVDDESARKQLQNNLLAIVLALLGALLVTCKFDISAESTSGSTGTRQFGVQGDTQNLLLEMSSDFGDSVEERTRLARILWRFPGPDVETETTDEMKYDRGRSA